VDIERDKEKRTVAVRPLYHRVANEREGASDTEYLYPLVSTHRDENATVINFFQLFQKRVYRKQEPAPDKSTIFFPFYVNATSEKYGHYKAIFPFYGSLYERLWRQEIHFIMFPLYSRTVNKQGITHRNYLYPFFSMTDGDRASGFSFWPLYGHEEQEGVFDKRFVLWPFYIHEKTGQNTVNPTLTTLVFPLYSRSVSPLKESWSVLWPFVGHSVTYASAEGEDRTSTDLVMGGQQFRPTAKVRGEEWDYLWPLWYTYRGEGGRRADSYLPFYSRVQKISGVKTWYGWPVFSRDRLESDVYREEYDRVLFWLYTDRRKEWPVDGAQGRRIAAWPLFLYRAEPGGDRRFSFPALIEPILDRQGVEDNWAPLWRIYQRLSRADGTVAESFLWNLYWRERRGKDVAVELFPLFSYRRTENHRHFALLKGIVGFGSRNEHTEMQLLWIPIGRRDTDDQNTEMGVDGVGTR
jgi:hypothetical protein